jgi:hypothetical protein
MIIERFVGGDARPVYRHLREQGRGVPDGVRFVDSWVDVGLGRCFQLMETDDAALLQRWVAHWQGLVEFEVVAVVPGADTNALLNPPPDAASS